MSHDKILLEKIHNKTAKIGVVGMGYVGLPFAVEKAKAGFEIIGIDMSESRVSQINSGISYITDVKTSDLKSLVDRGSIRAMTDYSLVKELDVIVICVPTPLTTYLTPDLQYVESVTEKISKHLRPGQLISLESTTYPGTTEEVMLPLLEKSELKLNKDFFLCHSPERVDPGNPNFTTKNTSKIVGGVGEASAKVAQAFYSQTISTVVTVSNAREAELAKVFENTFRAVNIALVNELAMLCDRMNLNVWNVLDAAFTKPFGIMPFYPGPGVGGHCIPIDPHYLEWKAREVNFNCRFISLAGQINRQMPHFVVEKVFRLLNEEKVSPSASRVLVLGVAYKKDVPDWRESPGLEIIQILKKNGVAVEYADPNVPEITLHDGTALNATEIKEGTLDKFNVCILVSEHSAFNWEKIVKESRKILDTRNALKSFKGAQNVVLL